MCRANIAAPAKKGDPDYEGLIILRLKWSGGGTPCLLPILLQNRGLEIPDEGCFKPVEIPVRLP